STNGDRLDAGVLQLLDSVVELVQRLRRTVDASLLKERGAVPDALRTELVRQTVGLAIHLPRGNGATQAGHIVVHETGQVLEVTILHLSNHLAAAPLLEQVGSFTGLQSNRNTGALEVLVLNALDLNGHVGAQSFELVSDRLPEAERRVCGCVVPP